MEKINNNSGLRPGDHGASHPLRPDSGEVIPQEESEVVNRVNTKKADFVEHKYPVEAAEKAINREKIVDNDCLGESSGDRVVSPPLPSDSGEVFPQEEPAVSAGVRMEKVDGVEQEPSTESVEKLMGQEQIVVHDFSAMRPGDHGASHPLRPDSGEIISQEESEAASCEKREAEAQEIQEAFQQFIAQRNSLTNKHERYAKLFRWGAVLLSGFFLLVLADRFVHFINVITSLPPAFSWLAFIYLVVLAVVFFVLLFGVIKLTILFKKPAPENIFAALDIEEKYGYSPAEEYWEKAKKGIEDLLRKYKTENNNLVKIKEDCLRYCDGPKGWLKKYDQDFLGATDRLADKKVHSTALSVGILTASNPIAFIDQSIIISSSINLTKELMILYGRRASGGDAAFLLLSVLTHTAAAQYMQDLAEEGFEKAWEQVACLIGGHSLEAATEVTGNVLGRKIGGKVMEGVINYFIIRRLGRRLKHALRPIPVDFFKQN